jgi:hypothetical protein
MIQHTKQYSALIDNYLVRHYTKPGITGWAQTNGYRGETKNLATMAKRIELDIWYIENWSFFLELKIIYFTVRDMAVEFKRILVKNKYVRFSMIKSKALNETGTPVRRKPAHFVQSIKIKSRKNNLKAKRAVSSSGN